MALNAPTLAVSIRGALLADPKSGAQDNDALTALCSAIANAVVSHIQSAGQVTVVTACGAGPGTGTGTVS